MVAFTCLHSRQQLALFHRFRILRGSGPIHHVVHRTAPRARADGKLLLALGWAEWCWWVLEDTVRTGARLPIVAHALRGVFIELAACRLHVETAAPLALPPETAHQTLWLLLDQRNEGDSII